MRTNDTAVGVDVFGATVRGPGHRAERLPNQDAWGHGPVGAAHVLVVSDGLGSRPNARVGSRAACRAVVDAARLQSHHPAAPLDVLFASIHIFWRARIAPLHPGECACTCLFAVLYPDGSGIAAQLGDGLVLLKTDEEVCTITSRSPDGFGNETRALGTTTRLSDWTSVKLDRRPRSVILCTDGVGDDIEPEKLDTFAAWLIDEVRLEPASRRHHSLASALRAWPTPHHVDDKTIAVCHVPRGVA